MNWITLLASLALLAGCYRPEPATVPLRTLALSPGEADAHCLVVFLPGRGDQPEDYARNRFPDVLRRAGARCAMVGVDSHLGYFIEHSIVSRLHEDVIAPARARGQDVWLVGISLGGLGALVYTREHPGAVQGLVLLSPYLGEAGVSREVQAAGGLAAWAPERSPAETDSRSLWMFLQRLGAREPGLPPVWLGYGTRDRFAAPDGLLAAVLPPDHVVTARGHHTWRTWRSLWEEVVKRGIPGMGLPPPPR